jgi:fermentation-respiration switch protein FrsA (DUF1100 family)
VPRDTIVVHGESLGGGVAAWAAEERQPGGLILESAFTALPDLAARLYPYLPVRWLCRFKYPTRERLGRIRCPVLILHSADDEMIPPSHGQELFAAAREPKTFVSLAGSHNSAKSDYGAAYRRGVDQFVSQVQAAARLPVKP